MAYNKMPNTLANLGASVMAPPDYNSQSELERLLLQLNQDRDRYVGLPQAAIGPKGEQDRQMQFDLWNALSRIDPSLWRR